MLKNLKNTLLVNNGFKYFLLLNYLLKILTDIFKIKHFLSFLSYIIVL